MAVKLATLNNVQSLGPLQRTYKWEVEFIWQGSDSIPTPSGLTEDLQTLLDEVNIRCISSKVPTPSFDTVTASPHGIDVVEPGIVKLAGTIDFTLVETTDLKARKILYYLQQYAMTDDEKIQYDIHSAGNGTIGNAVRNVLGGGGASTGSNDLTVLLHRQDNQNKTNLTYACYKCFISGVTDPNFESTNGNVQCGFTLYYNWFKVGFPEVETSLTNSIGG